MTNKVIKFLQEEDLIEVETSKGEYNIRINKQGILYLREYSRFYISLFKKEIAELYRYGTVPIWVESVDI